MDWLQFCYCTLCGYSKEEYLDSTLPELIYQIRNYKKFNSPPDKKGNYNNPHNNGIKSAEKETYSVDPETLARWAREEEISDGVRAY